MLAYKKMNKVARQEKKYLIGTEEAYKLNHYLSQLLIKDKHNGINGYIVRSLYFDTLYDKDFKEKEDGIELRRKIRLRIYNPDDDFAILEMKQKQGMYQLKRSLKITRDEAYELIKRNYSVLLNHKEDFAEECYGIMNMQCYIPRTIVQYNRKAFIAKENNIRITFDSNIIATETCFDLFDKKLNMYPVFNKDNTVLEVKYNGFLLQYIKDMLENVGKSELSVSKYCLARTVTLKYLYM